MFFKNIFRRRAGRLDRVAPTGEPRSVETHRYASVPHRHASLPSQPGEGPIRLWNNDESPEDYDASYVDAWFDARARRLLQAEFANVEPPANAFRKLLAAIEAPATHVSHCPALKPPTSPALLFREAVYRAVSSPMTARIAPSGVALLLAIAVLGPNLSQALQGESSISRQPPAASISSPDPSSHVQTPHNNPSTSGGGSPGPLALAQDTAGNGPDYDLEMEARASMGLPPLKQAYRAHTGQDRYERGPLRFGPE